MADKIEQHLTQGESITHRAILSKWAVAFPLIIGWLSVVGSIGGLINEETRGIGVGTLIFGGLLIGYAFTVIKSSYFIVTNKRVMLKKGIISTRSFEMLLTKVESIVYNQGLFDKLFGTGTIIITGSGGSKEIFTGILDPQAFKNAAQQEVENHHESTTAGRPAKASSADELTKLADLYSKGILTKDEFEEQKKKLLAV